MLLTAHTAGAWHYQGHRTVNQLALASLPPDFPAFVREPATAERIAFLAGEPDRWRNLPEESQLARYNAPDHFFDLDAVVDFGWTLKKLPLFRQEFVESLGGLRAAHPEKFEPTELGQDKNHMRELPGFLPWTISEYSGKLKSCFAYLKTYKKYGGTLAEIANAEADVVYVMGVMGHFVGDGSMPLHVSRYYNGWVGDNPHGYTTNRNFHGWIDGGYFNKTGALSLDTMVDKIRPARIVGKAGQPQMLFREVIAYLRESQKEVEPLYRMEKNGLLSGDGVTGRQGRAYLEGRLVAGGQMLGDIWYSAWAQAPEDAQLRDELLKRKPKSEGKP